MDIVGIDISRAKFDAALLIGERIRHGAFSNTEAGLDQSLPGWRATSPTLLLPCTPV